MAQPSLKYRQYPSPQSTLMAKLNQQMLDVSPNATPLRTAWAQNSNPQATLASSRPNLSKARTIKGSAQPHPFLINKQPTKSWNWKQMLLPDLIAPSAWNVSPMLVTCMRNLSTLSRLRLIALLCLFLRLRHRWSSSIMMPRVLARSLITLYSLWIKGSQFSLDTRNARIQPSRFHRKTRSI